MLVDILGAIEAWPVAAALRRSIYLYPAVNALHIFGLALVIGAIVPFDLRALGLFRATPIGPLARFLPNAAAIGVAVALPTGFLLFSVKPFDYAANPAFLAKVGLVLAGIANALAQRWMEGWRTVLSGGEPGTRIKLGAALSLVIWCAALMAGRMIAFLE
jgi:hypothetical protein